MRALQPSLVAVDLDGMLLGPDGRIGPRARRAIGLLRHSGVAVVLASGRSPWSMQTACEELALDGPQITMQGGLIVSPVTGECWDAWPLTADDVLAHLALARDCGVTAAVCFPDGWRAERPPSPRVSLPWIMRAEGANVEEVESLAAWAGRGAIRTFLYTPGGHAAVRAAAERRFGSRYTLTLGDEHNLELLRGGATKGRALRTVARRLGIPRERVAAIGDGPNDLPMFAAAGVSVATESAPVDVTSAASMVVRSNAAEGAEEALRFLFPGILGTRDSPSGRQDPSRRGGRSIRSDGAARAVPAAVGASAISATTVAELDVDLWFG